MFFASFSRVNKNCSSEMHVEEGAIELGFDFGQRFCSLLGTGNSGHRFRFTESIYLKE